MTTYTSPDHLKQIDLTPPSHPSTPHQIASRISSLSSAPSIPLPLKILLIEGLKQQLILSIQHQKQQSTTNQQHINSTTLIHAVKQLSNQSSLMINKIRSLLGEFRTIKKLSRKDDGRMREIVEETAEVHNEMGVVKEMIKEAKEVGEKLKKQKLIELIRLEVEIMGKRKELGEKKRVNVGNKENAKDLKGEERLKQGRIKRILSRDQNTNGYLLN